MTSAYGSPTVAISDIGNTHSALLPYVPFKRSLPNGTEISIDFLRDESDVAAVKILLNDRIIEGESWPFDEPLSDSQFRSYFFAHAAFVARNSAGDVIGAFYCKPNFPGRCSHYCNGGFITRPDWCRYGVGTAMGESFLRIAKDLGFKAALFNLVFASNVPSVQLWKKLGFQRLATLPRVGQLSTGVSDAYQYYYDLESGPKR